MDSADTAGIRWRMKNEHNNRDYSGDADSCGGIYWFLCRRGNDKKSYEKVVMNNDALSK